AMGQATNAQTVKLAGLIAEAAGSKGSPRQPVEIPAPSPSQPLPDASHILSLLRGPPRVVNVGLELFAESLAAQGAETVAVDWHPPAGGKQKPITWDHMSGPLRGAVIGGLIFEGLANDERSAGALVEQRQVQFAPCHHHGAVGPMAGVTTASMPVYIIENRAFGNRAYSTLNEG